MAALFDRCAASYRTWSAIASFGFVRRWRRRCVRELPEPPAPRPEIFDLMAGTGEVWPQVLARFPHAASITAVDISRQMHLHALDRLHRHRQDRVTHLAADVLTADLPPGAADCVVATFGLKTFDAAQQARLAKVIAGLLRPGGSFSLIEASDPRGWALRPLYRLHLDRVLPLIERLFLRGAQDFAMLGVYTRAFGDCAGFAEALRAEGLETRPFRDFFGCATGVAGRKPVAPPGPEA